MRRACRLVLVFGGDVSTKPRSAHTKKTCRAASCPTPVRIYDVAYEANARMSRAWIADDGSISAMDQPRGRHTRLQCSAAHQADETRPDRESLDRRILLSPLSGDPHQDAGQDS